MPGDAPPSRDDARVCARLVRAHARTFALASRFLPPPKRRAAYALYAFCRTADDLVDLADAADAPVRARLDALGAALGAACAGRPAGPLFRELHRAVAAHGVPEAPLRELLRGVARDLDGARYRTWDELAAYCAGVASSVGELCVHVFGLADGGDGARAVAHARTLGVAMQLTNILRDVGEDARRGRLYLPAADLVAHGLPDDAPLAAARDGDAALAALARDPRWGALVAFESARARALYRAAAPGIALLAPDARFAAAACATGYAAILDAIERRGHDTLTGRARPGLAARAGALWAARRLARAPRAPVARPVGAAARAV